jgi:hypothetical protein
MINADNFLHGAPIPLIVEEFAGIPRKDEPVNVGFPLPRGALFDPAKIAVYAPDNRRRPVQASVLSRWSDDSIKWLRLDFQADAAAHEAAEYKIVLGGESSEYAGRAGNVVRQVGAVIEINTGRANFEVDVRCCKPFQRVVVNGVDVLENAEIALHDNGGRQYRPWITQVSVESEGPLRTTLLQKGLFRSDADAILAHFISRLSFFHGRSIVEFKFTIRNPKSSFHPNGFWDLGDAGSIYFDRVTLGLALKEARGSRISWSEKPGLLPRQHEGKSLEIYQDSSGGENWRSSNHVNRHGNIASVFRGYRVRADDTVVLEGSRITPHLYLQNDRGGISAAIVGFWQNFPKALSADGNRLTIGLFPEQFQDSFELQGGEQKTHTVWFDFVGGQNQSTDLQWVHDRLIPRASPEWYTDCGVFPYFAPRLKAEETPKSVSSLQSLVDSAVEGANTFFDRREIIDEYGWRNFGDLYADHEAVGHRGSAPLVAHYNNQYDVIYGAIREFTRSGNRNWYRLFDELARHVVDIDLYHTSEDRPAFNGGFFWHTEHYTDAALATHRAYSRSAQTKERHLAGGGPSSEHNYTSGLTNYYFLTGDSMAREAVLDLANWVIAMDAPSGGALGLLDRRPRGLSTMTASWKYHGPGRGSANSINALLDAYALTRDQGYLNKAEALIRRCIHPKENIEIRKLDDVEYRWSYTVFLQMLGKYLDAKIEEGEIDFMYAYARESLLHYARWMLDHEVPYKEVYHKVLIPTETWPAQDIRKSNAFKFAARHADEPLRSLFLQKSDYFFERCITDLLAFQTCGLTRPIVLMLTNGFMHSYVLARGLDRAPAPAAEYDFGPFRNFRPQFYELCWLRERLRTAVGKGISVARRLGQSLRIRQQEAVN